MLSDNILRILHIHPIM